MGDKTFSGENLEQALREGTLAASRATTLTGMVKSSERGGYIGFTMAGCDAWVNLASTLIQSATSLGTSTCQDHLHQSCESLLRNHTIPTVRR